MSLPTSVCTEKACLPGVTSSTVKIIHTREHRADNVFVCVRRRAHVKNVHKLTHTQGLTSVFLAACVGVVVLDFTAAAVWDGCFTFAVDDCTRRHMFLPSYTYVYACN